MEKLKTIKVLNLLILLLLKRYSRKFFKKSIDFLKNFIYNIKGLNIN